MTRHRTEHEQAQFRYLAADGLATVKELAALYGFSERAGHDSLARAGVRWGLGAIEQAPAIRAAFERETKHKLSDREWVDLYNEIQTYALNRLRRVLPADNPLNEFADMFGFKILEIGA